jgi:hypothetical protein
LCIECQLVDEEGIAPLQHLTVLTSLKLEMLNFGGGKVPVAYPDFICNLIQV